ncbi:hypothetical protein, partial [Xanthomonas oryzae]|uniref:hypothetical protein n=1 Tax=Xanthomonas oryzae TaxID=347 RepID=UPI001ED8CF0C
MRGTNAGAHLGAMRVLGNAAFAQDNRCALARTIVMGVAGNASSRLGALLRLLLVGFIPVRARTGCSNRASAR